MGGRLARLGGLGVCALLLATPPMRADTVTLGTAYSGNFKMLEAVGTGPYSVVQEGGGSVGGSSGNIAGNNVYFAYFYCVDIYTNANLGSTYTSTYNTNATINGSTVTAAGQVAWLMLHIAPTLTTQAQYQGMQGLIWTLENPTGSAKPVQWDTADNSAAATSYYNTYQSLLGGNTDSVSSLYWINPINPSTGVYTYQGFVADTWTQIPEPSTIALFGISLVAFAGMRRRGMAGVTGPHRRV